MTKRRSFSEAEWAWLEDVRVAAAANPFGVERVALDRRLLEHAGVAPSPEPTSAEVREAVRLRVAVLEADGRADIRHARAKEIPALRATLLFDRFHAWCAALDGHIRDQLEAGPKPLRVRFAAQCLAELEQLGFASDEAQRVFAAFFQLRRAYYFISDALIGSSPCMHRLREQLWNNIFTHDFLQYERLLWNRMEDFSTLLLGETGAGKGAAAVAIGRSGFIPFDAERGAFTQSFTDIFLAVNLSQYAEALIESELFGHRRGAFTGAIENHEGVFARCRPNGSIFLDEIGDLAVPVQTKLLRVIQERVFSPVGSHEERRFAGRVIAATHRDLEPLRRTGAFRDDLYYRLCSDRIVVPSLRQRLREESRELDDLVAHILKRACGAPGVELTACVTARIRAGVGDGYGWPGNVRELEQAVRGVLLRHSFEGDPAARRGRSGAWIDLVEDGLTAQSLLARYCGRLYEMSGNYGEVARRTGLDRRTVRKYVLMAEATADGGAPAGGTAKGPGGRRGSGRKGA